jgi:hypothetical protein
MAPPVVDPAGYLKAHHSEGRLPGETNRAQFTPPSSSHRRTLLHSAVVSVDDLWKQQAEAFGRFLRAQRELADRLAQPEGKWAPWSPPDGLR